jgi:non-ribosomal peptide synthetase component F
MTTFATESTLLHGFLRNVADHPNRVAIIDGPRRIRYRDLARAAEAVRRDLAAAGVSPGDPVGIRMRRSWRVIAAIVAVLAAGARYVPLDPGYPRSRLDFMAADCGLRVVCTDTDPHAGDTAGPHQTFVSGDLAEAEVAAEAADSSGYVIYTSGSTAGRRA